jgi:inorganic pyrophosphatase
MTSKLAGGIKYWESLERLVREHEVVIDRKKGSAHPRYPSVIYPLDYGYLAGTTTVDEGGIDIFVGSLSGNAVQGIICTVDNFKKDAEIKIMYNCAQSEIEEALRFLNSDLMSVLYVARPT